MRARRLNCNMRNLLLFRTTGEQSCKRQSNCNPYIFEHLATPEPQYHRSDAWQGIICPAIIDLFHANFFSEPGFSSRKCSPRRPTHDLSPAATLARCGRFTLRLRAQSCGSACSRRPLGDASCAAESAPRFAERSGYNYALRAKSVVQCGQRVALIGIDIVHAGQSFATGSEFGFDRFVLLIARTSRKIQKATMRKLMTSVTKLP